jgi:hypothetical protein
MRWEFETQLEAVETQTICVGSRNTGDSTDKVKPLKSNAPTSWTVHHQFEAITCHDWTSRKKTMHLLTVLQGQAANIIHSVPARAAYEDIIRAPRGHYTDHELAAA